MWKAPPQRSNRIHNRSVGPVRAMLRGMRAVQKPILFAAVSPLAPFVECIAANPISAAQLDHAPVPRFVIRQHSNALFHATSLGKWHRRFPLRCTLTCRPSTRSKLSGIYPVCTLHALSLWGVPLTRIAREDARNPTSPRKRGEVKNLRLAGRLPAPDL